MRASNEQQGGPPDLSRSAFLLGLALALLLGAWAYAPALGLGYYADDFPLIAGADRKLAEHGLVGALREFAQPRPETHGAHFYRPLWEASFALDAALGASARASHALNLGLHLITSALVAWLGLALGLRRTGALAAAALHACFPAQHEIVGWVCARSSSLAVAFLCLSFAATATAAGRPQARARWSVLWQAVAALSLALAFCSKDTTLVYPALLVPLLCAQALARREPVLASLVRRGAPLLGVWTLLFLGRWWILGEPIGGYDTYPRALDSPAAAWRSFASLSHAWTWPLSEVASPTESPAAVLLALVLVASAAVALALRQQRIAAVFGLGVAWSWLGLVPVIGYLQRGLDSVDTRYFYLPSLGTALAWGAWIAAASLRGRVVALSCTAALAGGAAFALRLHLAAYEPGDRAVRALVEQAAQQGRRQPDQALLVFGVEAAIGPVYGNTIVFPSAMSSTFADVPRPERFHGFADDMDRWGPDEWMTALLLLDPSTPRLAWDAEAQRIVEVDWPLPAGSGAAEPPRLEPEPDDPRAWSLALSVEGAPVALLVGRERDSLPFGAAGTVQVADPEVLYRAVDPGSSRFELRVPPEAFEQGAWLQVLLPTRAGALLSEVVRVPPRDA